MDNRYEWLRARDGLATALAELGHPAEMSEPLARQLGSPKAIARMTAYLRQAKPRSIEEVVDEMLAICSDIETWRNKKAAEQANAKYNEMLNYGLDGDEE